MEFAGFAVSVTSTFKMCIYSHFYLNEIVFVSANRLVLFCFTVLTAACESSCSILYSISKCEK